MLLPRCFKLCSTVGMNLPGTGEAEMIYAARCAGLSIVRPILWLAQRAGCGGGEVERERIGEGQLHEGLHLWAGGGAHEDPLAAAGKLQGSPSQVSSRDTGRIAGTCLSLPCHCCAACSCM